jgi:hypothetical protein
MGLLTLILILVLVGILLYAINRWVPMDPKIKQILNIVVVIIVVLWLLTDVFHLLPALNSIKVGG